MACSQIVSGGRDEVLDMPDMPVLGLGDRSMSMH